jgi:1-acyl-sn-glycerol-3-phosphate acyltransferase
MSAYKAVRGIVRIYAKFAYRVKFHGRENEPKEGAYIAFSNHTSFSDPLFTASALKRPLYFLAKSDLQRFRFLKWLFNKCNVVPINRGESDIAALRKTCDIIKGGNCPALYPEGTRIPQAAPKAEDAQAGIGLMATRTKATLLPVTICYGKKRNKPIFFRKVHVYIGKPIPYEEYSTINEHPNSHEIAVYAFSKLCEDFERYNHD